MRVATVEEGSTRLLVPRESLESSSPPSAPAFFNPAASVNRDVSVAVTAAAGGTTMCDSLAGVGARGVRVANETPRRMEVTVVDFNRIALRLAERSARLNGVRTRCDFVLDEARRALYSRHGKGERFDFVDVDPFGSPAPFIAAAVSATADGGTLSLTATDTAALCGVYPAVTVRRYAAAPLNNEFHHETGARILMNAVRREAAAVERGIVPVAAHCTRHYIRVYARLEDGPARADASVKNEGYVTVCRECFDVRGAPAPRELCELCGGKVGSAGPLWLGPLTDGGVVGRAATICEERALTGGMKVLAGLKDVDAYPPWGYSIDGICSRLRKATVPESGVREYLGSQGFHCGRQPFEKRGIKTDAPYASVREAVERVKAS